MRTSCTEWRLASSRSGMYGQDSCAHPQLWQGRQRECCLQRLPGNDTEKATFWKVALRFGLQALLSVARGHQRSVCAFACARIRCRIFVDRMARRSWPSGRCAANTRVLVRTVFALGLLLRPSPSSSRCVPAAVGAGADTQGASLGDQRGARLCDGPCKSIRRLKGRASATAAFNCLRPVQRLALVTAADTCNLWPYLIIRRHLHARLVQRIRSHLLEF